MTVLLVVLVILLALLGLADATVQVFFFSSAEDDES